MIDKKKHAQAIISEIEKICCVNGIYYVIEKVHKPELEKIRLTIDVKISKL